MSTLIKMRKTKVIVTPGSGKTAYLAGNEYNLDNDLADQFLASHVADRVKQCSAESIQPQQHNPSQVVYFDDEGEDENSENNEE